MGDGILMDFPKTCCLPLANQHPLLNPIFQSFTHLWVNIRNSYKSASSNYSLVQCSRSKSMTYLRKGCLLRFQSNSTAPSDDRPRLISCKNSNWLSVSEQRIKNLIWNNCSQWYLIECRVLLLEAIRNLSPKILHTVWAMQIRNYNLHYCSRSHAMGLEPSWTLVDCLPLPWIMEGEIVGQKFLRVESGQPWPLASAFASISFYNGPFTGNSAHQVKEIWQKDLGHSKPSQ